jgi:predicted DNA-binding transcriptional regulator AlpA
LARLENLMNGSVLGSWQEIANYIGRRPRTVQRWERQFGMPVHRRRRDKRRAVFAFSGELDHWLRSTPSNRACGGQRQTTNATMEPFRQHSMSGFLNSWKEVAQFVGLGVRTVQRLEQHSGFPVHRPACKLRSPIIAIPEEIEHWLDNRPFGRHESAGCTAARKSNAMPQYFT